MAGFEVTTEERPVPGERRPLCCWRRLPGWTAHAAGVREHGATPRCTAAGLPHLSLLERGVRSPMLRTLFRLAKRLGHVPTWCSASRRTPPGSAHRPPPRPRRDRLAARSWKGRGRPQDAPGGVGGGPGMAETLPKTRGAILAPQG